MTKPKLSNLDPKLDPHHQHGQEWQHQQALIWHLHTPGSSLLKGDTQLVSQLVSE